MAATLTSTRWDARTSVGSLPPDWPLVLVCAGMPFTFLLGLHALVWVVPAVVFGLHLLLRREPIEVPRSAIPLMLLVAWIPIPLLQLEAGQVPLALFRFLVFLSPLLCFLWLVNQSEVSVPTVRIVRLLSILWVTLIAFGFLAILFPHFSAPSPIQRIGPGSLFSNEYIRDMTRFQFAQVQSLVSEEVGRPAAPLAYSNGWGSTLGLLTPFFVLDYFVLGTARRRRAGLAIAAAALIPIIVSLNRGLWLSVGVALAYVAIRRALQGNVKVALVVGAGVLVVLGTLTATTLGDVVSERFEIASESNNARGALYDVAIKAAEERPVVGWGAPVEVDGLWREVGTHGLLWFVMVCYGFPGLILLLAWMAGMLFASARAPNPIALWAHVAVVVFVIQVPIYGLLPQLVLIGTAAAVSYRAQRLRTEVEAPSAMEIA
jgi:polysaccharide biosynthesis protein PslJ